MIHHGFTYHIYKSCQNPMIFRISPYLNHLKSCQIPLNPYLSMIFHEFAWVMPSSTSTPALRPQVPRVPRILGRPSRAPSGLPRRPGPAGPGCLDPGAQQCRGDAWSRNWSRPSLVCTRWAPWLNRSKIVVKNGYGL